MSNANAQMKAIFEKGRKVGIQTAAPKRMWRIFDKRKRGIISKPVAPAGGFHESQTTSS